MLNSELKRRRLRPAEAAEYAGLSASTLAKHRCRGTGPAFIKAGRVVLYEVLDIDNWLSGRRRLSTSDTGDAR